MKKNLSNNIQTLEDVHRRQIELKRLMQVQKEAMIYGIHDISEHIKPGQVALDVAHNIIGGLFQKPSITQLAVNALIGKALVNNITKNQRSHPILSWGTPLMLTVLPKVTQYFYEKIHDSDVIGKTQAFVKKVLEKFK